MMINDYFQYDFHSNKDKLPSSSIDYYYPANLIKIVTLNDGSRILIRPIKRTDNHLFLDFFKSLSKESRYLRYFSYKKDMSLEETRDFITVNYKTNFALVAIPISSPELKIIGVARYEGGFSTIKAEIAVLVTDEWQNKGLGTILSDYLLQIAKKNGILKIYGEILLENKAILNMMKESKFEIKTLIDENILYFEFNL